MSFIKKLSLESEESDYLTVGTLDNNDVTDVTENNGVEEVVELERQEAELEASVEEYNQISNIAYSLESSLDTVNSDTRAGMRYMAMIALGIKQSVATEAIGLEADGSIDTSRNSTMEKEKGFIGRIWESIKKFFAAIWNKIKAFFKAIINFFTGKEKENKKKVQEIAQASNSQSVKEAADVLEKAANSTPVKNMLEKAEENGDIDSSTLAESIGGAVASNAGGKSSNIISHLASGVKNFFTKNRYLKDISGLDFTSVVDGSLKGKIQQVFASQEALFKTLDNVSANFDAISKTVSDAKSGKKININLMEFKTLNKKDIGYVEKEARDFFNITITPSLFDDVSKKHYTAEQHLKSLSKALRQGKAVSLEALDNSIALRKHLIDIEKRHNIDIYDKMDTGSFQEAVMKNAQSNGVYDSDTELAKDISSFSRAVGNIKTREFLGLMKLSKALQQAIDASIDICHKIAATGR